MFPPKSFFSDPQSTTGPGTRSYAAEVGIYLSDFAAPKTVISNVVGETHESNGKKGPLVGWFFFWDEILPRYIGIKPL